MNNNEFTIFLRQVLNDTENTLNKKAAEYAPDGSRFHNFDVAKLLFSLVKQYEKNYQAAFGLSVKHLVSIIDLLNGDLEASEYYIREKFGDMINYLILMQGMLLDEIHNNMPPQAS
jgi:hypothetical protein